MNLPAWRCHKIVRAAKIVEVVTQDLGHEQKLRLDTGDVVDLPKGLAAVNPVGGYYVLYGDGYTSYSPGPAFEAGYSPIETAKQRAEIELRELSRMHYGLEQFLLTDTFKTLPEQDRDDLDAQLKAMREYRARLASRLSRMDG